MNVPATTDLNISNGETLLLAAIQTVKTVKMPGTSIPFYERQGLIEVVDLNTIQCLVGQVQDTQRHHWGIIDRSGPLAEATFVD